MRPRAAAGHSRVPVAMARGKHLFPFRTEQLSPSAPMVLGPQGPGRVGRRRFTSTSRPRAARPRCGAAPRRTGRRARRSRRPQAATPPQRRPPMTTVQAAGRARTEPGRRAREGARSGRRCGWPSSSPGWSCGLEASSRVAKATTRSAARRRASRRGREPARGCGARGNMCSQGYGAPRTERRACPPAARARRPNRTGKPDPSRDAATNLARGAARAMAYPRCVVHLRIVAPPEQADARRSSCFEALRLGDQRHPAARRGAQARRRRDPVRRRARGRERRARRPARAGHPPRAARSPSSQIDTAMSDAADRRRARRRGLARRRGDLGGGHRAHVGVGGAVGQLPGLHGPRDA